MPYVIICSHIMVEIKYIAVSGDGGLYAFQVASAYWDGN